MRQSVIAAAAPLLFASFFHAGAQSPEVSAAETAVRALIQTQAEAFNRDDLDGTMATLSPDIDWRTISQEWIEGGASLRESMRGWMDVMLGLDVRMVYPPDSVRVQVLAEDHAVADVVLIWDAGPERSGQKESLFYVFRREGPGWRIVHVRNTTTHPCAKLAVGCRPGT